MSSSSKPEDTASRQRLLRLGRQLFALAIGIVGGIAAYFAGLPLPWVTGPLISVAAASILGWPIEGPLGLMPVAFILMGASGGSGVTPEALGQIHKWPLSLAVLFITFPLGSWIGYRMLRRWGWDRDTAVLSALPGALSVITATAIDRGADVQRVAGVQTLRVVILVLFLPMIVLPDMPSRPSAPFLSFDLLLLISVCAAAGFIAARMKVPGGWIVGALIASAALHGSSATHAAVPPLAMNAALVCLGTVIGSRFASLSRRILFSTLGIGVAIFAVATIVAAAGAVVVSAVTGMDFILPLLAFAPGGLDAMIALATVMHLDPAYVGLHHILRFLAISLSLPWLLRNI
ncbi:MAG: AbrB family transcriptional regulator [Rhodobiaceae bacterium]|nr:AbrB family transcriptional regulator [Rhodobiaceae bacterium]MCC0055044.1 AbrB family transcriptional regulator [Rhodobiaceae bacterium]